MDSGIKLWGVLSATAIVVSNDSPALVKAAARLAKIVFGARIQICDGTDDHVQIQAAIDALPVTGGKVVLLDGTYNITTTISIVKDCVAFEGQGESTIIFLVADSNTTCITVGDGATVVTGVAIRDLYIDGNQANNATGLYGIYFNKKITNSIIEKLAIVNTKSHSIFLYSAADGDANTDNIISKVRFAGGQYRDIQFEYSHNNVISQCKIRDKGIYVRWSDYNIIEGNNCQTTAEGIVLSTDCRKNVVIGNICHDCTYEGIFTVSSIGNTISSNHCFNNTLEGIRLDPESCENIVVGNICQANRIDGIYLNGTNVLLNVVSSNICFENRQHGINLGGCKHTSVEGNLCYKNSLQTNDTYSGIYVGHLAEHNSIQNNTIRKAASGNTHKYGIDIALASAANNRVIGNDLYDAGVTANFRDAGTGTRLASITVPFVDGTDPQDSGYLIDSDTEYARAFTFLNFEVIQVVRMKVYARAVPTEADKMRAEFVIYGGADNEAYNTHDGSVADHPSTSSDFAADDVIYWTITEAGILALLGGDSVEVKVLHEAAGNGDIDTQAYFRTVTIEFV